MHSTTKEASSARGQSKHLSRIEDRFVEACLEEESSRPLRVARYLSRHRLQVFLGLLVSEVASELEIRVQSCPSRSNVLRHLEERNLIVKLAFAKKPAQSPYWLRLRGGSSQHPNPLELASSIHESAIVSDLTAMRYHGLNQFQATSEFIRKPIKHRPTAERVENATSTSLSVEPAQEVARMIRPGTPVFELGETTYFSKNIVESAVFGVQQVFTDEREQVNVFNRERALLMALTSPQSSGGIRGVLDAWKSAASELRISRIEEYVRLLSSNNCARRVGAIAESIALDDLAAKMESILSDAKEEHLYDLPIVAGYSGGRLLERWGVLAPW